MCILIRGTLRYRLCWVIIAGVGDLNWCCGVLCCWLKFIGKSPCAQSVATLSSSTLSPRTRN
jgi:hypothetical protein